MTTQYSTAPLLYYAPANIDRATPLPSVQDLSKSVSRESNASPTQQNSLQSYSPISK